MDNELQQDARTSRKKTWIIIAVIILFAIPSSMFLLKHSNVLSLPWGLGNKTNFTSEPDNPIVTHFPSPANNQSSSTFNYDVEKAQDVISAYIKDTIKSEFIPEDLDIEQGLSIDNRSEDDNKQFGSYYTLDNTVFSINAHYREFTNTFNDFIVFIQPQSEIDSATPEVANSLTSIYFNSPFLINNDCKTQSSTVYCENFQSVADGKRGYGLLVSKDSSNPDSSRAIVFTCFIPKESKDYINTTSCISP
jgi:hypothetical protein